MFNNLTYKQKCIAIVVVFVVLLMAAYKKTIRQAFAAKNQLNHVEQQLLNVDHSYNTLYSLKREVAVLDNIIGGGNLNPELVQQSILDFITNKTVAANIVKIEDVHVFSDKDFKVYSNQIEIEGAFNTLVELLYAIEKEFKASRITSSSIYSKKNYRTNRTKLYLKLVLQNYEKNK